jgi:hypothetical protein
LSATFQNIYLFPAPARSELASLLQRHFKAEGYKKTKGEDGFDLSLSIVSQPNSPAFISIEASDIESTAELAASLADSLQCDVLITDVLMSDLLALTYRSKSSGTTSVLQSGIDPERGLLVHEGEVTVLVPHLVDGDITELIAAWEAEYTFAEEHLVAILTLLGCDSDIYSEMGKKRTLHFLQCELGGRGYEIIREGPPLFYSSNSIVPGEFSPERIATIAIQNRGGPSKGISVLLEGELIEALLDDPDGSCSAKAAWYADPTPLVTHESPPDRCWAVTEELYRYTTTSGSQGLRADLPEVVIPNGFFIPPTENQLSYRPAYYGFKSYYEIVVFAPFIFHPPQTLLDKGIKHMDMTLTVRPHENWDNSAVSTYLTYWFSEWEFTVDRRNRPW